MLRQLWVMGYRASKLQVQVNLLTFNLLTFNSLTNDQLVRSGNPPPENFQQGGKGLW